MIPVARLVLCLTSLTLTVVFSYQNFRGQPILWMVEPVWWLYVPPTVAAFPVLLVRSRLFKAVAGVSAILLVGTAVLGALIGGAVELRAVVPLVLATQVERAKGGLRHLRHLLSGPGGGAHRDNRDGAGSTGPGR